MNLQSSPAAARRPLVIAHRGASADEPEHTRAAYDLAREVGADGYECDVRLTVDHELVCIHDRTVDRTTGRHGVVSTMTTAELERLDWGSWKGALGERDPARRESLLTLEAFLDHALTSPTPLTLLIETKHPSRHGARTERRLAAVLAARGLAGSALPGIEVDGVRVMHPVRVMSFSRLAMTRMGRLCPTLDLVFLVYRTGWWDRGGRLPRGVRTLGIDIRFLRRRPEIVSKQRARGHRIFVWTVDEPQDVRLCLDLEVDAIITNRPAQTLDQVRSGY